MIEQRFFLKIWRLAFFWWKTLHNSNNQNDRVYTISLAVIDESVRKVYNQKKYFYLWCGLQSSNIGSHLWFWWNRQLRSTQTSTLIILWLQLLKRWKYILTISLLPSTKWSTIHTSIKTQFWCSRHFPRLWSKEMCPHASPDLNTINSSVWSVLKTKVSCVAHTSVDVLKRSLLRE